MATLRGVAKNIEAGREKTKQELGAAEMRQQAALEHAAREAAHDRDQSREQAALERQHSAEEARRDRLTAARRDVYLSAVEQVIRAQTFLSTLPNKNLTDLDLSTITGGLFVAINRVACVGEMATALKARELGNLIGKKIIEWMTKLIPLSGLRSEVQTQQKFYDSAQEEIARILAAMRQHNESPNPPKDVFEKLQRSMKHEQERATEFGEALSKLRVQISLDEMEAATALLDDTKAIAMGLDDLLVMVRAELELQTDIDALRNQTMETFVILDESIQGAFGNLRNLLTAEDEQKF